jgi:hypothetical protein
MRFETGVGLVVVAMMLLLVAAVGYAGARPGVRRQYVDMAEINHVVDDQNRIQGVQVIFWQERNSEWIVRDYLAVPNSFPGIPEQNWTVVLDRVPYTIYYGVRTESWTRDDPEMDDRFKHPVSDRRLLFPAAVDRRKLRVQSVLKKQISAEQA